jgi:hypothetical protein
MKDKLPPDRYLGEMGRALKTYLQGEGIEVVSRYSFGQVEEFLRGLGESLGVPVNAIQSRGHGLDLIRRSTVDLGQGT